MTFPHLTILGGGPAGLAVGYFAGKQGIPFTLYERAPRVGGNAITFRHGEFLYDSGAHRFHDKYPDLTAEIKELLGDDLKAVEIPSNIYDRGVVFDFPLSPLNLIRGLGVPTVAKASIEILKERTRRTPPGPTFADHAIRKYGQTLAERFLLNYSEKLWGRPCDQLSPSISGQRLKGLNLPTFLKEAVLGRNAKTKHLDGSFYYPTQGIGMIVESLANACGKENIQTQSEITRIVRNGDRIEAVEINGDTMVETKHVVNTLPLPLFLRYLDPQAPEELLQLARGLQYRNLILIALFLDIPSVSDAGSLYFPDPGVPFTRVYEPRNRSEAMSPHGKTSLIAEIPCSDTDPCWSDENETLIADTTAHLVEHGLIRDSDIFDATVHRFKQAYPVLDIDSAPLRKEVLAYASKFTNMTLLGRNAEFLYTHIHDMLRAGKDIFERQS